jgi:hypothetical protein
MVNALVQCPGGALGLGLVEALPVRPGVSLGLRLGQGDGQVGSLSNNGMSSVKCVHNGMFIVQSCSIQCSGGALGLGLVEALPVRPAVSLGLRLGQGRRPGVLTVQCSHVKC